MKKKVLILISIGILVYLFIIGLFAMFCLNLIGYNSTPEKIERYIKKHCNFDNTDTCYIDLRKALKVDFDTLYIFNEATPLTGVQNILGINDYGKSKNPEQTLIVYGFNMRKIILLKNNKVVYEDEYHTRGYNTTLYHYGFTVVTRTGVFDGSPIEVEGYMYANHIFKVEREKDPETFTYYYDLLPVE